MLLYGSIALAALWLIIQWLLANKKRSGWLVSFAANTVAIPYDFLTHQYGFVVVELFAYVLIVNGWRRWRE